MEKPAGQHTDDEDMTWIVIYIAFLLALGILVGKAMRSDEE